MYKVGGTLLSKDKHRGNRVTIRGLGGERTVLKLRYEGKEASRFGPMHKYVVTEVVKSKLKLVRP